MTGERILLVEDAEDTRNFLAESVLIPEGFEVMAAANSTEAISVLQNWQPHLIVADYLMPKMTGLELLEYLKQNGSELPFILITAEGSEALAVRAMRLGVRDYLIKPFNIDDFLNAIQRVLATPQAAVPVVSMSQRLEQLLQNSNAGILSTDLDNHILYLNQTFQDMFELTKSAVGRNLNDLISNPELLEVFDESGQPYLTREIDLNGEHTLSAIFSQMPGVGKLAVMQDITEYKKLDRTRTEFITAISHDLRSPLTTIMGYVELLERTGPLNEVQKKFTDHIIFSVRSITALLSDLLELSKVESGFMTALQPINMTIITRYALETHRSEIDARQQNLVTDIATDTSDVLGNPIRLKQMASNLLQNASKYTPPGGSIRVRVYEDDDFIIFQVEDTGIGIPVEDQARIWEKFYRTEEATAKFPGTGLGLAIVKSIVDAHAGRIWVESVPLQGTTFTVMLPIASDDENHQEDYE